MEAADLQTTTGTHQHPLLLPSIAAEIVRAVQDDVASLKSMKATSKAWRELMRNDLMWRDMVKTRFGKGVKSLIYNKVQSGLNPPFRAWQAQYFKLSQLRNTWHDGDRSDVFLGRRKNKWFRWEDVPGALSHECVTLVNVCWLHLSSTYLGVTPGTYRLVHRMRFNEYLGSVDMLHFTVTVTAMRDQSGNEVQLASDPAKGVPQDEWVILERRQNLEAPGPSGTPRLRLPEGTPTPVAADLREGVISQVGLPNKQALLSADLSEGRWLEIEVAHFTVPEGYYADLSAAVFEHTNWWKSGLTWDVLWLERQDT